MVEDVPGGQMTRESSALSPGHAVYSGVVLYNTSMDARTKTPAELIGAGGCSLKDCATPIGPVDRI